jgi:hypothetical protein
VISSHLFDIVAMDVSFNRFRHRRHSSGRPCVLSENLSIPAKPPVMRLREVRHFDPLSPCPTTLLFATSLRSQLSFFNDPIPSEDNGFLSRCLPEGSLTTVSGTPLSLHFISW